jgi:hypothetical protein
LSEGKTAFKEYGSEEGRKSFRVLANASTPNRDLYPQREFSDNNQLASWKTVQLGTTELNILYITTLHEKQDVLFFEDVLSKIGTTGGSLPG